MTDANRRRLILLAGARSRTVDATGIAMRLHEDLVMSKLEGSAARRAREIVDTLVELRARIDVEIGEVPST
jgi:hypothetical protein